MPLMTQGYCGVGKGPLQAHFGFMDAELLQVFRVFPSVCPRLPGFRFLPSPHLCLRASLLTCLPPHLPPASSSPAHGPPAASLRFSVFTGRILVHCAVGVSRSATLVLAYLMLYHRLTLVEAIKKVKDHRGIIPNRGFLRQLLALDRRLRQGLEA